MTNERDKVKQWRPRFTVRTLLILVTLVAAYFGAWEATKRWGCSQVHQIVTWTMPSSPAPLIVVGQADPFASGEYEQVYYLWYLVGYVELWHAPFPDHAYGDMPPGEDTG